MNSYPITHRRMVLGWQLTLLQLATVVFLCAGSAAAQAVVEYAGAVASVGGGAASLGKLTQALSSSTSLTPSLTRSETNTGQPASSSAHLPLREVQDVVGENRRALEAKAGKNAAKLMLRSQPGGAWVFIDGKGVGKAPLLLILAPGVYRLEMLIPQRESSLKQVDLLPKETREVLLTLAPRYPNHVELSWQRQ